MTYEKPICEIKKFNIMDVVTTSDTQGNGSLDDGKDIDYGDGEFPY